ncbi:hypothetical protein EI427_13165 [Flammeovirga pectinis]|uniref:Peptidase S24/S26A/S26B/S26C domain-containing protein n=1 Tax=Flammeovirga pectinis TaxID=2494373 RepID=A0A3Q9FMH2_9BACT|nr:S24 family peptidase [Flammeovirga pectinis]AZQ63155.1 hypothetical protein EI427_13165 [Flammeovirga pectinis]
MSKITHTGFQSPAGDYEEDDIKIDQYLLRNPYATFVMRMQGDAMKKVGLFHNDLLLVDKSLPQRTIA